MSLWWWLNESLRLGKRVRRIQVNLWDDYKQEPEYSITNPTTLKIEDFDGQLNIDQILEMRNVIFNKCLEWRKNSKCDNVGFAKNPVKFDTIDIVGLNEECRKSLFKELKKCDNEVIDGFKIKWLMES